MRVIRILRLALGVSIVLLGLLGSSAAEEPTDAVLAETGAPLSVVLDQDTSMRVLKATAPAGAKALHVIAVAPYDIDLYVHGVELTAEEVEDARYVADSTVMVESVIVTPNAGEVFDESQVWYVHVVTPWANDGGVEVSVAAFAERDEPVLVPGEGGRVEIPAGRRTATARFLLPRGVASAAVRAEASHGMPTFRGTYGRVEIPALRRGRHQLVHLAGHPEVTPGAWRFEVGRPKEASVDAPYATVVTPSVIARLPEGDAWDVKEPRPLDGVRGDMMVTLEEDAVHDVFLDVRPPVYSVLFQADFEGGDVDLYATPDRPVVTTGAGNWHYAAWKDGREERLLLGGTEPLPVGRYWIRVRHVGGEAGAVRLTWESRARVLKESEMPAVRGTLGDAVWRVEMEANEPTIWWDLVPPAGPGSYVQVFGSDKDVDLLLMRTDTGAAVLRRVSPLYGERLQVPPDLVVPDGVGLRVGLCRWNVTHPVSAGELHLSLDAPPKPPAAYFPPYEAFGDDQRSRTLAAAVHVDTDDGAGSAVVVSPTGLLLTCHHVIEEVPPEGAIRISFPTGPRGRPRQLYYAKVVDSVERDDLALLELTKDVFGGSKASSRRLPFVPLGSSRSLELEAPLRIVGYGYAGSSSFESNLNVMHGILSGVELEGDREVWLITDARLGSGNSGAGFFDTEGRLVGVHSCSYGDTGTSLCYARPVSAIPKTWLERIRREGGSVAVE